MLEHWLLANLQFYLKLHRENVATFTPPERLLSLHESMTDVQQLGKCRSDSAVIRGITL